MYLGTALIQMEIKDTEHFITGFKMNPPQSLTSIANDDHWSINVFNCMSILAQNSVKTGLNSRLFSNITGNIKWSHIWVLASGLMIWLLTTDWLHGSSKQFWFSNNQIKYYWMTCVVVAIKHSSHFHLHHHNSSPAWMHDYTLHWGCCQRTAHDRLQRTLHLRRQELDHEPTQIVWELFRHSKRTWSEMLVHITYMNICNWNEQPITGLDLSLIFGMTSESEAWV